MKPCTRKKKKPSLLILCAFMLFSLFYNWTGFILIVNGVFAYLYKTGMSPCYVDSTMDV